MGRRSTAQLPFPQHFCLPLSSPPAAPHAHAVLQQISLILTIQLQLQQVGDCDRPEVAGFNAYPNRVASPGARTTTTILARALSASSHNATEYINKFAPHAASCIFSCSYLANLSSWKHLLLHPSFSASSRHSPSSLLQSYDDWHTTVFCPCLSWSLLLNHCADSPSLGLGPQPTPAVHTLRESPGAHFLPCFALAESAP